MLPKKILIGTFELFAKAIHKLKLKTPTLTFNILYLKKEMFTDSLW